MYSRDAIISCLCTFLILPSLLHSSILFNCFYTKSYNIITVLLLLHKINHKILRYNEMKLLLTNSNGRYTFLAKPELVLLCHFTVDSAVTGADQKSFIF